MLLHERIDKPVEPTLKPLRNSLEKRLRNERKISRLTL
jgi:hypothetical protein